ncbi:hypothetical protein COOONC_11474 [Cooperia oncophora]
MSSAWFISDLSKQSSLTKKPSKKDLESAVSLTTRTLRGQDKLSRAKVRSLRITLLLILVYVITWLPNNLLSWWMGDLIRFISRSSRCYLSSCLLSCVE